MIAFACESVAITLPTGEFRTAELLEGLAAAPEPSGAGGRARSESRATLFRGGRARGCAGPSPPLPATAGTRPWLWCRFRENSGLLRHAIATLSAGRRFVDLAG